MNLFKVFPLFVGVILFSACGTNETSPLPEKKTDDFQFSFIGNPNNLEKMTFEFSAPNDYSQLAIKETIYQLDQSPIEATILTATLAESTGEVIVEKTSDETLTRFNFQVSSADEIALGDPFPLNMDVFSIWGPNMTASNQEKMNFFAYKEQTPKNEQGEMDFTERLFEEPFDVSANLQKEEIAVVWSYEFIKK